MWEGNCGSVDSSTAPQAGNMWRVGSLLAPSAAGRKSPDDEEAGGRGGASMFPHSEGWGTHGVMVCGGAHVFQDEEAWASTPSHADKPRWLLCRLLCSLLCLMPLSHVACFVSCRDRWQGRGRCALGPLHHHGVLLRTLAQHRQQKQQQCPCVNHAPTLFS